MTHSAVMSNEVEQGELIRFLQFGQNRVMS